MFWLEDSLVNCHTTFVSLTLSAPQRSYKQSSTEFHFHMSVDNLQKQQKVVAGEAQIVSETEPQLVGEGERLGLNPGRKSAKRFQNRSAMVLAANILRVATQGIGRTHMMYKANLSHRMLNSYLAFLSDIGLISTITKNGCRTTYQTTEKGKRYIEIYNSLLELSDGIGKFSAFSDPFDGDGGIENPSSPLGEVLATAQG